MKGKRIVDNYSIFSYICGGASAMISALLDNPVAQWTIFGLSILLIVLNIISTIISLWKKAKSDGKITIDEIGDIVEGASDALKDGIESLKKGEEDKKND